MAGLESRLRSPKDLSPSLFLSRRPRRASGTNETFSLRWIYRVRTSGVRVVDRAVVGPIPHAREPVSALIVRWSRHRSRDRTRSRLPRVSLTQPCHTSPSRSHGPWHFVLLTCRRTRNSLRREIARSTFTRSNVNREKY